MGLHNIAIPLSLADHYGGVAHLFIKARRYQNDIVEFRGFITPNIANPEVQMQWYGKEEAKQLINDELDMMLANPGTPPTLIDLDKLNNGGKSRKLKSYPFRFKLKHQDIDPQIHLIFAGSKAMVPIYNYIPRQPEPEPTEPPAIVRVMSPNYGIYDDIDLLARALYQGVQFHMKVGITEAIYYCRPHVVAAGIESHPLIQSIKDHLTIVNWNAVVERMQDKKPAPSIYYDQHLAYNHALNTLWGENKITFHVDHDELLAIPNRMGRNATDILESGCLSKYENPGCLSLKRRVVYSREPVNYLHELDMDPSAKLTLRATEEYSRKRNPKTLFWPDAVDLVATHSGFACLEREQGIGVVSLKCNNTQKCTHIDENCVFVAHFMQFTKEDGSVQLKKSEKAAFEQGVFEDRSWQ